jgi:fatty acid desaturase
MDDKIKQIESLLESVAEYGKASYELGKLKLLDKTSDAVSSFIPHAIVLVLVGVFMLFLNLGLAFWLGKILGNIYLGFFALAAFYGIIGIVMHFFMHKWLKKLICNYIIKKAAN